MQEERRALVDGELADYWAMYGDKEMRDARRKAFRARLMNEYEERLLASGEKSPSETKLERLANGDPRYHRYLRMTIKGGAYLKTLIERETALTERVKDRAGQIYYRGKEAQLQ